MPQSDAVASIGAWMLENGHRAILAVTGGRWPRKLAGMQTLELHVIGRKSGQKRSTLLTAPICEDDRVVIVASKGGYPKHPGWFHNLKANPETEVQIGSERRPVRARVATAAEHKRLWPKAVAAYSGYRGYQERTGRQIPLVILERR